MTFVHREDDTGVKVNDPITEISIQVCKEAENKNHDNITDKIDKDEGMIKVTLGGLSPYEFENRPTWNGMILHDPTRYKHRKQKSKIWMYGGCEENADSTINTDILRCGKCGWKTKFRSHSTTKFLDHLRKMHMIDTI